MRPIAFYAQLAKELGSVEAAIYFQQLFYWSDKGSRADGFIYKTKKDIEEETTLSDKVQDRCRKILEEKGFIETKLVKANGAPTLHYKCLKSVKVSIIPKGGNPLSPKGVNLDYPQRGQSITEITRDDYNDFAEQNFPSLKKHSSSPTTDADSTVEVDGEGMPVPAKARQTAQEGKGEAFRVLREVHDLIVKETGLEPILGPSAMKAVKRALQYLKPGDVVLMVGDAIANGYAHKTGMSLNAILSDARINKFRLENY